MEPRLKSVPMICRLLSTQMQNRCTLPLLSTLVDICTQPLGSTHMLSTLAP